MSIFSLYLVSILDNFRVFLLISIVISIALIFIGILRVAEEKEPNGDTGWLSAKIGFFIFIFSGIFLIITPTTKSAVAVIAGYTILEYANTQQAHSITSKSYQVLNKFLDDQIKNESKD